MNTIGPQDYDRRTVPDLLQRSRLLGEDRPVLFDLAPGREYSYAEFLALVAGAAAELSKRYRPGERIAVAAGNGAAYFILRYALACAGLVEVALNGNHRGPVLAHMLEITEPRAILLEDRYAANLDTAGAGLHRIERLGGNALEELTSRPGDWNACCNVGIGPSDACRILFTSGTTGRSKAVELSHAYEVHTGERHVGLIGIGPEDRWLYVTPMFHIDAVYTASILFHTGGAMALAPDFSVSRFWSDVAASGATYLGYLGALFGLLLKGADPPPGATLKVAVGGGASQTQIEEVERRFNIHVLEAFAMTECIACTINRFDERRLGTAGRAIKGYQVAISDPDGGLLPAGETGEIVVRSEEPCGLFSRYVGDLEATSRALRDGWFHTGDLGMLDEEGYLTYRGRLKDAIRIKGENVAAVELEAIAELHPGVSRTAAVGTASEIGDEEILLYVETTAEWIEPAALCTFIAERAAGFMVPRYIQIATGLPLTATGKVNKSELSRQPDAQVWVRPSRRA